MRPVKKIVLLHDLCTVGKAALTNLLPVLSAMGVEACPIPTVLLSSHTGGYGKPAISRVDPDYIRSCAAHYRRERVSFDCIFAGYPGSAETLSAVADFVHAFPEVPVIFDPIMGDHGKYYGNFDASYGKVVSSFLCEADVLLPNLTEACLLSGIPYRTDFSGEELLMLCRSLDGPDKEKRTVILTSVPSPDHKKGIAVYQREREREAFEVLYYPKCPGDFHGTGDLFDGVFAAEYIMGSPVKTAVGRAHAFVKSCIETSIRYGYPEREGLMVEESVLKYKFPEN